MVIVQKASVKPMEILEASTILSVAPLPVKRGLDVWMAGCFPLEVNSILEGDISVMTVVMT
jgi:hypothetical protein